ncbi:hypothetical protein SAMN05444161_4859 [Rhizobiales bacterium GAS191]|nr:hypothetical protein SAMN05519103_04135 [Rhizobiales bacterium GAS113]SEE10354.1 hypothetical protein SAMN05444161_4859 [Rhizobiales bacterium GAS191]
MALMAAVRCADAACDIQAPASNQTVTCDAGSVDKTGVIGNPGFAGVTINVANGAEVAAGNEEVSRALAASSALSGDSI